MPTTPPPLDRAEIFSTAHAADRKDPAFAPNTPDEKAQPSGESLLAPNHRPRFDLPGINRIAGIKPLETSYLPSDADIPDNYVTATIQKQKYLPPVTWKTLIWNIQWISFLAITVTPSIAIYGIFTTNWNTKTAIWS